MFTFGLGVVGAIVIYAMWYFILGGRDRKVLFDPQFVQLLIYAIVGYLIHEIFF